MYLKVGDHYYKYEGKWMNDHSRFSIAGAEQRPDVIAVFTSTSVVDSGVDQVDAIEKLKTSKTMTRIDNTVQEPLDPPITDTDHIFGFSSISDVDAILNTFNADTKMKVKTLNW